MNLSKTLQLTVLYYQVFINGSTNCPLVIQVDQECTSKFLYFGKRDLILAIDEEHFSKNCNSYEEGMICLDDYIENCLIDTPRIASQYLYKTVVEQFKRRCEEASIRDQFIQHSQCLRNQTILEQFHQCCDRYFAMVDQIQQIPYDLYVPAGCCIMIHYQQCIEKNNRELCNDRNDDGKFWTNVFDELAGDIGTFCYGYENIDNCYMNFPQDIWVEKIIDPVNQMDQEKIKKRNKFHSMFFANLDIAIGFKL